MVGPPGTGKTMLAKRIAAVLPPLGRSESLETTRIYSSLGLLPDGVALMDQRPVRMPHHSATAQALIGGGTIPRPGEVSLAHNGILFLDELPEFSRYVLETLRQPLENGDVTIARVHGSIKFPARFMLVAAMNPTASGFASTNPRPRQISPKTQRPLAGPHRYSRGSSLRALSRTNRQAHRHRHQNHARPRPGRPPHAAKTIWGRHEMPP